MTFYNGEREPFLYSIFVNDGILLNFTRGIATSAEIVLHICADFLSTYRYTADGERYTWFEKIPEDVLTEEYYNPTASTPIIPEWVSGLLSAVSEYILPSATEQHKQAFVTYLIKSCKYGSLTSLFYKNRDKFLPDYDWVLINSRPKLKKYVDSAFKEFDRLCMIIDSVSNYTDVDKIPADHLVYMMELLGFTVNDYDNVIVEPKVRNLMKNLIEVYKYKGSLYSFELFFESIGIDVSVKELFFDRRYYFVPENTETKSTTIGEFKHYLTSNNPSNIHFPGAIEKPSDNDFTETKSHSYFDKLVANNGIANVLGYGASPVADPYTFFKSNVLFFKFFAYNHIDDEEDDGLTLKEKLIYIELFKKFIPAYIEALNCNDLIERPETLEDIISLSFTGEEMIVWNRYEVEDVLSLSLTEEISADQTPSEQEDNFFLGFDSNMSPLTFSESAPSLFESVDTYINVECSKVDDKFVLTFNTQLASIDLEHTLNSQLELILN